MNFRSINCLKHIKFHSEWLGRKRLLFHITIPIHSTCNKFYSNQGDKMTNEWEEKPVTFSTSKAAKHSVNESIGYYPNYQPSIWPVIGGVLGFSALMYVFFFWNENKSNFFEIPTFIPGFQEEEKECKVEKVTQKDK